METKSRVTIVFVALLLCWLGSSAQAGDEWEFGIGTGFFALNLDGDFGLSTVEGPATLDIDLDNSEVSDLMNSAAGFSGFAAKGKWRILYSASYLELEGDGSGPVGVGDFIATDKITFDSYGADLAGVYNFATTGRNAWGVLFGLEYTKHELENDVTIDDSFGVLVASDKRKIDEDWLDGVIGFTHALPITEKVSWTNLAHAAYGGSEGTYLFNTGINWQAGKHWLLSFYGQYEAVDFENGNEGDADWYLFDIDEFGAGFGVTYTF